jgi:flagellar assembly protein FliH
MSNAVIEPMAVANAFRKAAAFRALLPGSGSQNAVGAADNDPYAQGIADGQDISATTFAVERDQLNALLASARALQPEPSEELAQLIAETVQRLVRQIVEAAPIDGPWLSAQAEKAASVVAECDAARTMWLHPDDLALLDTATLPLAAMTDPSAERGSIRIDCSAGWITHGRSIYLDALRTALAIEEQL